MRVGVYVDGYNLYYGGRSLCGRGTADWRWLDIRALAETLIHERANWPDATVDRVVYCTARIDAVDNPSGYADQDVYLKALATTASVDYIEYGYVGPDCRGIEGNGRDWGQSAFLAEAQRR